MAAFSEQVNAILEQTLDLVAQLSPEQIDALTAQLLERRQAGRQPQDIFLQLARLSTIGTVEVAPIRDADSARAPQILLSRRPESDPHWGGLWHLPGNVIVARPQTEVTEQIPMNVLADGVLQEFTGVERVGDFALFDAHPRTSARGTELTVFGHVPVDLAPGYDEPEGGHFFSFDTVRDELPPEVFITGHPETLLKAMQAYKRKGER